MIACLVGLFACGDEAPPALTPMDMPPSVPPLCEAGRTRPCYDGPEGTQGVGRCVAGSQACLPDGSGWGLCTAERRPIRERCGDDVDDDCDGRVSCGEPEWLLRFGTDADETVMAVGVDDVGHGYVLGYHRSPLDLGTGPLPFVEDRDVFLASFDRSGDLRWAHTVTGDGFHLSRALSVGRENVVFAMTVQGTVTLPDGTSSSGGSGSDVLLLSLAHDGTPRWHLRIAGDGTDGVGAVTHGPDGRVLVAGWHRGTLALGALEHVSTGPHNDVFVASIEPSGEVAWVRFFDGLDDQIARGLVAGPDGIYLSGYLQGQVDFGDGLQVAHGSQPDAFLVALDGAGATRWSARWGGVAEDRAFACAAMADGVVVVGRTQGELDVGGGAITTSGGGAWVASFDGEGAHRWSRSVLEAPDAGLYDVAVDDEGAIVVAGYYEGQAFDGGVPLPDGGIDHPAVWLSKLRSDGTSVWSRGFPVAEEQTAGGTFRAWRQVAARPDGSILLGGYVRGPWLDEGMPGGRADAFVMSLAP